MAEASPAPWECPCPDKEIWTSLKNEFLISVRQLSLSSGGGGKQAANGIKKLIAQSCGDTPPPKFWSDYFQLWDILDEKQSHIIQPVLKEKINIFRCLSNSGGQDIELCHWFMAILLKMIRHDNRHIVKEGFLRFLSLGESQVYPSLQELLVSFLHEQIFPIVKDYVGWIFSEPEKYFDAITKFGVFIRNVYRNLDSTEVFNNDYKNEELQIIVIILRFLVQDGTCRSPAAGYFVVKSLAVAVSDVEAWRCGASSTQWNLPLLEECCFLLSTTARQGLTAVDLFLRREIEGILLNIFLNRIIPIMNALEMDNLAVRDLEWFSAPMFQNILGFMGALPLEKLINCATANSECFLWFDEKLQHFLPSFDTASEEIDCSGLQILSGVQLNGFVRMVWLSVKEKNEEIRLTIFKALCKELVSKADVGDRFKLLSEALTEYQHLCNEWMKTNNKDDDVHLKSVWDSATQTYANTREQLIQDLNALSQRNISKEIFVQTYQNVTLLEVLSRSCSTFVTADESLLQKFFERLCLPNSAGCITSCSYAEFLVWRILAVLPIISVHKFRNDVPNVLNLFLEDSCSLAKEDWLLNGVDLRTEFYQVKFNGLSSFFAIYGSEQSEIEDGDVLHDSILENKNIWKNLLSRIITDVDKGGFGGVTSATKCVRGMVNFLLRCDSNLFKMFCNDAETMTILKDFIHLAWNLVFEMRKTESFWTALEEFVLLISHPCHGQQILTTFADKCFKAGETVMGLPLLLMQSLTHTVTNYFDIIIESAAKPTSEPSIYQEIVQICLNASLSGLSLPKNLRVTFALWVYLLQKTENDPHNEPMISCIFSRPPMVRLSALSILQTLLKKLDNNPILISSLVERILHFYLDQNDKDLNKQYFANSPIHRKRLRLAQALLVFQPHFNKEQSSVLLNRMLASLSDDNLQPSIRYYSEWIIIRVLVQHNSTWESFFDTCVEYWTNRIGFASRFASICLHATRIILYQMKPNYFIENALKFLAQLALGHHVTVRVYSQTCFQKVYEALQCSGVCPELISKYDVIYISLREAEKFCIGSSAKINAAMENDFYIQLFNPVSHYSLEVIFIHLPRISEVANDELPIEWCLLNCGINITTQKGLSNQFGTLACLQHQELKELYATHCKTAWHLRTTPVGGRELGELSKEIQLDPEETIVCKNQHTSIPSVNFQKKVNPWKTLSISDSLMDSMKEECTAKKRAAIEDGLVVVASLVDRSPNLGGLCRSCEIFGVSKYVIPTLNILNDQQFQNLSVSSHTWVDLVEVPPKDLHLFISTYKLKGYRILGIEQALKSTPLNDFIFPKKSLLILGNERYGIPSELLPLLDVCIEVPQVGVVRSLNVHVSGALAIWQYSCQHAF